LKDNPIIARRQYDSVAFYKTEQKVRKKTSPPPQKTNNKILEFRTPKDNLFMEKFHQTPTSYIYPSSGQRLETKRAKRNTNLRKSCGRHIYL
jgi:hypothetical protein